MDRPALSQWLGEQRFAASLPASVVDQIATIARPREVPAGSRLFREGSQQSELMIVCGGRVGLDMSVPGRGEIRILSLGAGDVLAWSALLGGGRMTASATTLEDTQLLVISAPELLELCALDAGVGYHVMGGIAAALAERLLATRLQLLDLFADAAQQSMYCHPE